MSWHQQICERLIEEHSSNRQLDLDQAWRLKGSSKLTRRSLAILKETWHWREHEAVKANKPPYFIVRHEDLVRLAETVIDRDTKTVWPHKLSTRRFNLLREAVGQALDLDSDNCPEIPQVNRRRIKAGEKKIYESLKKIRDKQAEELKIDPTLIASRSTLVKLSLEDGEEKEKILPWQRDLLNL